MNLNLIYEYIRRTIPSFVVRPSDLLIEWSFVKMRLVDRATAGPVPACIAVTTAREAGPRLEEDYSGCFDDDKKMRLLARLVRKKLLGPTLFQLLSNACVSTKKLV